MSVRKTNNPEIEEIRKIKARGPVEWKKNVDNLPIDIRPQVARVIWWDFFAGREFLKRWSNLDCYLNLRSPKELREKVMLNWTREQIADSEYGRDLSREEMTEALVACGYPPMHAFRRARVPKTSGKR